MGKGWRGDRYQHGMASKGVRTKGTQIKRVKNQIFHATGRFKNFDISRHYWSISHENGKWKLSLGNWTDAGWYWSGDEKDMLGFFARMEDSQVKDEIIPEFEEEGLTFEMFKPLILKSLKEHNSGMYELSGDNNRWKFGYGYDFDAEENVDYYSENYNISDSDKEEIAETYWNETMTGKSVDIDLYEKTEDYKRLKKEVVKRIQDTHDWKDLAKAVNDLDETGLWNIVEYTDEIGREELDMAFESWKAKQEKKGRKIIFQQNRRN